MGEGNLSLLSRLPKQQIGTCFYHAFRVSLFFPMIHICNGESPDRRIEFDFDFDSSLISQPWRAKPAKVSTLLSRVRRPELSVGMLWRLGHM